VIARTQSRRSARRARTAQAPQACPVLPLALEYERLAAKHLSLDTARVHQTAPVNQTDLNLLDSRLASIADEASYLVAHSATGALFQIMLLRDQHCCSTMEADAAPRECELRRIERLAYRLKNYFLSAGADALPTVAGYCMSDSCDPHRQLEQLRA
jgi:hypothetical protein